MRFVFGKQDLADSARRAEHCFLLTNGLGGFCSQTLTGGAARNDHALLMACTRAPNVRWNIVHRVEEELTRNEATTHLSTQTFAKGSPEEGWQNLCFAQVDGLPRWVYQWQGVQVEKELAMDWEQNTVALRYQLENPGDTPCTLTVTPWLQFVPKGKNLRKTQTFTLRGNRVTAAGLDLTVRTNGQLTPCPLGWQTLYYPCDAPDGRRKTGLTAACLQVVCTVAPGSRQTLDLVFTLEKQRPRQPGCCGRPTGAAACGNGRAGSGPRRPGSWPRPGQRSSPGGTPPAARPFWQATPSLRTGAGIP